MCAKHVQKQWSEVVPGFSYYDRDMLHPMTDSRSEPPEWCERPLEQVVLEPDADVEARPDGKIEYDGNGAAQTHREMRMAKW